MPTPARSPSLVQACPGTAAEGPVAPSSLPLPLARLCPPEALLRWTSHSAPVHVTPLCSVRGTVTWYPSWEAPRKHVLRTGAPSRLYALEHSRTWVWEGGPFFAHPSVRVPNLSTACNASFPTQPWQLQFLRSLSFCQREFIRANSCLLSVVLHGSVGRTGQREPSDPYEAHQVAAGLGGSNHRPEGDLETRSCLPGAPGLLSGWSLYT